VETVEKEPRYETHSTEKHAGLFTAALVV